MTRSVDDILALVYFTSENIAKRMIRTLNRIFDTQGFVTISTLCDKTEIEITPEERSEFDRIFWNDRIPNDATYPIIKHEEIAGYGITFPPLQEEES